MYGVLNRKVSLISTVQLSKEAFVELVFWNKNVDFLNCRSPWLLSYVVAKD